MHFLVLRKRAILVSLVLILGLVSSTLWLSLNKEAVPTIGTPENAGRDVHMVTGEFKTTLPDGKVLEAYRWDPGTIVVDKGEKFNLIIYGVNGAKHAFYIEGTDIKGVVKKGEETVVPLQFNQEGTYRLICETHMDKEHNGPMIAYIVVD